ARLPLPLPAPAWSAAVGLRVMGPAGCSSGGGGGPTALRPPRCSPGVPLPVAHLAAFLRGAKWPTFIQIQECEPEEEQPGCGQPERPGEAPARGDGVQLREDVHAHAKLVHVVNPRTGAAPGACPPRR